MNSKSNNIKITKSSVIWNYIGTFFNLGVNLIILPIILVTLSTDEVGVWYVFLGISGIISIMDFGFSPSLSRAVTSAWSGAKKIEKNGYFVIDIFTNTNYSLTKNIYTLSKRIYILMTTLLIFLLIIPGSFFILSILPKISVLSSSYYIISWVIYSIGTSLSFYFSHLQTLLKGIGLIKLINLITILSRIIFIFISTLGLILGFGLISIASALLFSSLIMVILGTIKLEEKINLNLKVHNEESSQSKKDIFYKLIPNSAKYSLVTLGGYLSSRALILLTSTYLGLEVTASIGLTMQILDLIGALSQLLFHTYSPKISSFFQLNKVNESTRLFAIVMVFQLIVAGLGLIMLNTFGNNILGILSAETSLINGIILFSLSIIMYFDWNTSVFINFIMSTNEIPFAKTSIISGIIVSILAYLFLAHTDLGLWAIVISRASVGILFNSWYWPFYVFKKFKVSFIDLFKIGFSDLFLFLKVLLKKLYKSVIGTI
jgi:O-antigen/teichoic acid export membrane protein